MVVQSYLIQTLCISLLRNHCKKKYKRNLTLHLYLKKTSKCLSIKIRICLLIGQLDKFSRRPKYCLLNQPKTKLENSCFV